MEFSLTTRWNAGRHSTGAAIIAEIRALGIDRLELGYDTTIDLVPDIQRLVAAGEAKVDSVHNFCPLPIAVPRAHPDLFNPASLDARERASAIKYTTETIRFAAEIGARAVVFHSGHVSLAPGTSELIRFMHSGHMFDKEFERRRERLIAMREKHFRPHLNALHETLAALLPVLEESRIKLGLEIAPFWEGLPSELEAEQIILHFNSPWLGYWHDIGHGQMRENLGFSNHLRWLERLRPHLVGIHIHDIIYPTGDHVMPPHGSFNFELLRAIAQDNIIRVFEPRFDLPMAELVEGMRRVEECWSSKEGKTPL